MRPLGPGRLPNEWRRSGERRARRDVDQRDPGRLL